MIQLLSFLFYISVLFLIIFSLYPGSLIGFLLYGDLSQQPYLIKNPFGTTINHFFAYFYVGLLGFFLNFKKQNFRKLVYSLFFLSLVLEVLQFIVPNRSFQLSDLVANILGVLIAYLIIKIYLLLNRL